MNKITKNLPLSFFLLTVIVFLGIVGMSFLGKPVISFHDVFYGASTDRYIFLNLRLPRMILAFMIGGALSVSGVSFQSLLKNPLADPYILGISGGAALGYVLAVVLGFPFILVPVTGFVFALITLFIIYRLACNHGVLSVINLLLIGIVFNAFSFALILVINSLANFGQAQQILYLLLGSVDPISWDKLIILSLFVLAGFSVLMTQTKKLNILSLGDEEAHHLGLNVDRDKKIIFVTTSLLVGASVSLCGLIGFIGLIIPHFTRLIFGADNRVVMPAGFLLGGLLLMFCDFMAGNVFSFETLNTRLPVGAVTALIGAPLFVWLLKRRV